MYYNTSIRINKLQYIPEQLSQIVWHSAEGLRM